MKKEKTDAAKKKAAEKKPADDKKLKAELEETKKQLDVEMLYRDSVPYENGAEAIDSLAAEGCSVIICNSFNYGESIQAAAEKYPAI